MPFKPGKGKTGGRIKGIPNKVNADLKQMILNALDKKGGVAYLARQADENPTAFMSLIGRVLPLTISSDPNAPISVQIVSGVPRVDPIQTVVADTANGHASH
jgi:hypothetical protein